MTSHLPNIYLFNPTCEYAIANGHASWQPNRLLQKMEQDLDTLPLYFARTNDVIVVKQLPPDDYLATLERIGIEPPRFFLDKGITTNVPFINHPKNRLLPWGWSPAAHRLLDPLKPSCSEAFKNSPVANWKPEFREIYSKKFALRILKLLLPELPQKLVLPQNLLPEISTSKKELMDLLERWGKIMVKAPWSSSGRGLQSVTKKPVVPKVWEKLLGIIHDQGYVIVEPFLNKVLDLALEFELKNGKVAFRGISRFFTDSKGQYRGNYLNDWPKETNPEVVEFAEVVPGMIVNLLMKTIEASQLAKNYEGYFGVDMLIFRDENEELRINPCLEINVKQNMGLLSLSLEKLLTPGKKGVFKTFYQQNKSFLEFKQKMETSHPPILHHSKIESGFFALTPALEDSKFGAYLMVSE